MAVHTQSVTGIGVNDDVFHDIGMWIVVVLFALVMLISALGIGLVYLRRRLCQARLERALGASANAGLTRINPAVRSASPGVASY